MYQVEIVDELDSGHVLTLPYDSKCNGLHGHRWKVRVVIESLTLNPHGMVVDFLHIKRVLREYDHKFFVHTAQREEFGDLDGVVFLDVPPTAERLAELFYNRVSAWMASYNGIPDIGALVAEGAKVVRVDLWETPSGKVTYCPG